MGAFGRRFKFSFSKIGFSRMLSLGIAFAGMCFLEHLVDGLNSREYFAHFQKYPWWRVAAGGGPMAKGGGRRWSNGDRRSGDDQRWSGDGGRRSKVVWWWWRVTSDRWQWVTIGVI